jgi:hypothetical protein
MLVATCRPRDCLQSRVESGNNLSSISIRANLRTSLLWNHLTSALVAKIFHSITLVVAPTNHIYKIQAQRQLLWLQIQYCYPCLSVALLKDPPQHKSCKSPKAKSGREAIRRHSLFSSLSLRLVQELPRQYQHQRNLHLPFLLSLITDL